MTTRELRARRRRLARSLPDVEGLISGSVVEQGRRCGKEGCRCATGELHGPYTYVVLPRVGGRTRTVYVPAAAAEAVREGAALSAGCAGRWRRSRRSMSSFWPVGSLAEWPWSPRRSRWWPTWRSRPWRSSGEGRGEDHGAPSGADRAHLHPPVIDGAGARQHRVDRPPVCPRRRSGPAGLARAARWR